MAASTTHSGRAATKRRRAGGPDGGAGAPADALRRSAFAKPASLGRAGAGAHPRSRPPAAWWGCAARAAAGPESQHVERGLVELGDTAWRVRGKRVVEARATFQHAKDEGAEQPSVERRQPRAHALAVHAKFYVGALLHAPQDASASRAPPRATSLRAWRRAECLGLARARARARRPASCSSQSATASSPQPTMSPSRIHVEHHARRACARDALRRRPSATVERGERAWHSSAHEIARCAISCAAAIPGQARSPRSTVRH